MRNLKKVIVTIVLLIMVLGSVFTAGQREKALLGNKLSYWSTDLESDNSIIERITNEIWNVENPDAMVKYEVIPGGPQDFFQKLSTAFAAGQGPDIFTVSAAEFNRYVESGIAMQLDDWINPNIDDFYAATINGVSNDGHIYGYPGNGDLLGLYVNVDMFDDAGLDFPETWDETITAAEKLAKDDVYGLLVSTSAGGGYGQFEHYPFMWMGGGNIFAADNKTVIVNSQATIDAFQFYRNIAKSPGGARSNPLDGAFDITLFGAGKVAMQLCGSWGVGALASGFPDLNYTIIPYPVPKKGMKSSSDKGGWHFMASTRGSNPDRAADYLNWLYNNENTSYMEELCERGARFSPRKSVIENADFYKEFPFNIFAEKIAPIAQMEPRFPAEVMKAYGDALEASASELSRDIPNIVAELELKIKAKMK